MANIYKNSKPYGQTVPLDVNGTIVMNPGTYIQGTFFARAASLGILTDTGQTTMSGVGDSASLLLYVQNETGILPLSSVTSADITDGTIVAADLATSSVTTPAISVGAVTNVKIATSAVEAAAIKDGEVTNSKFSANSIDGTKIVAGSITATQLSLAANSITTQLKIDAANCVGATVTESAAGLKITVP